MNNITLKPIDQNNFITCFNLELGEGQDKFVSHPIRSLAQAYVYRDQCTPFGNYDGDTMVGYVMVIYDDDECTYNIWHLMIDRRYQGVVAHAQEAHHLHMRGDGAGACELRVGVHTAHGVGHTIAGGAGGHVVGMQRAALWSVGYDADHLRPGEPRGL